jgi:ferredoxin
MAATRDERIATRTRNEKWQNVPLRIEMSECINCDACLRHCPPHFGAIFNHGADVIIYPDPDWEATTVPEDWWDEPNGPDDPYR